MPTTQHMIDWSPPPPRPDDIIAWAEENVRLIGSVRSERYDSSITPWTIEPIQRIADDSTRIITLVKPVQTGGSRVGLIGLCWFARFGRRHIQYNWEDNDKAKFKWENETLATLQSCKALQFAEERFATVSCYAKFSGGQFMQSQGALVPSNLDSDSIPEQVNEEIHSWPAGHLGKARGRQTAVFQPKALDISNAGFEGDQLWQAFQDGTMQHWEVKCPGCGLYHEMHTRWEDKHPERGGLRYDSEGCKLPGGKFDYNKLEPTIRFQMPCGYPVRPNERKALSLSGRYGEPKNAGAHLSHRSYTYESVAVDFIPWIKLIQKKHTALRALKGGDEAPWIKYIQEDECRFYKPELRPYQGQILINTKLVKNRDGMPNRISRNAGGDKQQGYKHLSELRHYWLVIRDMDEHCNTQLVFEGKISTDNELTAVLDDHGVARRGVVIDATWDHKNTLEFCFRNGINATVGSKNQHWFTHAVGNQRVKRFFSEPKPIHVELNVPPRFSYVFIDGAYVPHPDEPLVWEYNKAGLLSNLFYLRDHKANILKNTPTADPHEYITWDVPGDVSEDYQEHLEAWEMKSRKGRYKEEIEEWQKTRPRDHMLMCEAYIAMLIDMDGRISERMMSLGEKV